MSASLVYIKDLFLIQTFSTLGVGICYKCAITAVPIIVAECTNSDPKEFVECAEEKLKAVPGCLPCLCQIVCKINKEACEVCKLTHAPSADLQGCYKSTENTNQKEYFQALLGIELPDSVTEHLAFNKTGDIWTETMLLAGQETVYTLGKEFKVDMYKFMLKTYILGCINLPLYLK